MPTVFCHGPQWQAMHMEVRPRARMGSPRSRSVEWTWLPGLRQPETRSRFQRSRYQVPGSRGPGQRLGSDDCDCGHQPTYPTALQKGHEWSATIGSRTSGVGCPYCSGKAVIQGETDLATTHPDLVTEVVQGDPTKVSAGSEKRFRWRCDEGHEWDAIVANRANGVGCPVCSNQLLSVGHNDLATVRPDLVRQLVDTDPTTVLAGSARKCRWRCDEGHEWTTAVNARMSGRGCPSCAKYGFDPGSPAWIYLLEHPTWNLLQVGITNVPEVRLNQHGRLGWEVLDLRGPMDGVIARSWESSILHLLKSSGGIMATKEIAGKFSGFTEAWSMGSYPVTSLRELMDAVDGAES